MSEPCQPIRDAIAALQEDLQSLQEEFQNASTTVKGLLSARIRQVRTQITQKQRELQDCQNTRGQGIPGLRIFGSEINQGLKGYKLVAGKDTLARVFVGAPSIQLPNPTLNIVAERDEHSGETRNHKRLERESHAHEESSHAIPSPALHEDIITQVTRSSTLDFAILRVQGPQGLDFEVIGQMSSNVFTNTSQSFSEIDNINFYLDGSYLSRPGQYNFTAKFFRNNQQIGTLDLGSATFYATRDLCILVVQDIFPLSAFAWDAIYKALLRVGRNFPIRSGVGPMDSGLPAGLRYVVDPIPFDPDFPRWGPVRRRFQDFNDSQSTQGKPDRADRIMTVRTQQPTESCLGGVADMPGIIAAVVLNTNEASCGKGASYITSIMCQEVGHTFGIDHSPNAAINDSSAFDLLNRRSIPNPSPFMGFGYTNGGQNDESLFEPQDWNNVAGQLST